MDSPGYISNMGLPHPFVPQANGYKYSKNHEITDPNGPMKQQSFTQRMPLPIQMNPYRFPGGSSGCAYFGQNMPISQAQGYFVNQPTMPVTSEQLQWINPNFPGQQPVVPTMRMQPQYQYGNNGYNMQTLPQQPSKQSFKPQKIICNSTMKTHFSTQNKVLPEQSNKGAASRPTQALAQVPPKVVSLTQAQAESSSNSIERKKPSVKFVAVNYNAIQSWQLQKSSSILIYEVFGLLDSQITVGSSPSQKDFVVKDNQGHRFDCSFFESDRSLVQMCRGKMYRCVGEFQEKRKRLMCVSIREASSRELQAYRKLLAISNNTIKKITSA